MTLTMKCFYFGVNCSFNISIHGGPILKGVSLHFVCVYFKPVVTAVCFGRGFPVCENPGARRLRSDLRQPATLPRGKRHDHRFPFQGGWPLGQRSRPPASEEVHDEETRPSEMKVFCHRSGLFLTPH